MSQPCGNCAHFDVVLRAKKETDWGWCAKYSVYPFKEGPGQIFPPGVTRVASREELAKPHMVRKLQVVENCPNFNAKKPKLSKMELVEKAQQRKGRTTLR